MGLSSWASWVVALSLAAAPLPGSGPRVDGIQSIAIGDLDGDGYPDLAVGLHISDFKTMLEEE